MSRSRIGPIVVVVALLALAGLATVAFVPGLMGSGGGGCTDQRQAGLVPTLEKLVPATLEGRPADRLDSAVTCSPDGLGSLAGHGVASVASAGGLWELGPATGVTLAVFRLDGPERADRIAEFYAEGAAQAPKVANLVTTHPTIAGRPATRLDFSDANFPQAIVVWPAAQPDLVHVVLAAGVPDRIVQEAIAAFGES
ncbi:MAG TPA: hypothetical protein VFS32_12560 [Candidatus Limnocylindrales bacterium]|nr:hypothetical protein [Candidatus Limnocylindrales bacterium]